jgi:hypothetical protein
MMPVNMRQIFSILQLNPVGMVLALAMAAIVATMNLSPNAR